jgi:hypothetical protein
MKFEAYIPYNITQAREAKRFNEKEIAGTKVEFDFQDIVGKYDRFEQNGKEIFFPPNFTAREIIIPWLIKGNIPKIKSEWICVKDNPPTEKIFRSIFIALIYSNHKNKTFVEPLHYIGGEWFTMFNEDPLDLEYEVIYYMPLPEPPNV